ncbi:hypothetical protein DH2020_010658 [Rehmannia glutinosa]|uniref:F-box associated beta-propeller type 1 domain-containing protein n=1 Tax=Rehmannia glutinosa TaxID=99300 RepID=A0ABR0XB99_REHGL
MYTPNDSIRLVGCCDGLICILIDQRQFVLWNPSTRTYKKLCDVRLKHVFVTKYGFGLDESSGDYKVFAVLSMFLPSGRYQAIGKIYSLKTNSWKTLMEKDDNPFDEAGKFVSGKLHWPRKFGLNNCGWDIVSFDLKTEVYGIVEQPNYREGKYHRSLGVLEGCLCVLCDFKKIGVDVWVMKEYGVKESWVRVLAVPYPCDPWGGPFSTPFCIGSKGEFLFMYELGFLVYYPKDKMFRRSLTVQFASFGEAIVYVESKERIEGFERSSEAKIIGRGKFVKGQAATALKYVQSEIRAKRMRM